MLRKLFMGSLFALGVIGVFAGHQPPSPSLEQVLDNTVKIEVGSGEVCSGFVLKGTDEVVTAAHCFEFDPNAEGAIVHFNDGQQAIFSVVAINDDPDDDTRDWAVLVLNSAAKIKMPVGLDICQSAPKYGDKIVAIGAPYDVWPSMSFGRVQNPGYKGDNPVMTEGALLLDVKVLPGNSGGPVVEEDTGCVIGTAEEQYTLPGHATSGSISIAAPLFGRKS
jgi:S1-C subfamily serine protease